METKVPTQDSGSNGIKETRSYYSWIAVVVILLLTAYLRLYKITDYMTFLGDEGRDVLVVKHLLEGDWVGLGPTASVGGFFTGPIYYYFMAPFLWLFGLDPVGPAIMVALFGIATVFLVYLVGKEFFNTKAGLFAATLYAVSPLIIAHSRSSWNPNPLPFFSLFAILLIYKAMQKRSLNYMFFAGVVLGVALQLHYIAIFLMVIIALYIFLMSYNQAKELIKNYIVTFFGFLLGYSPFLAFEATHGFPNTTTVVKFVFGSSEETGFAGDRFIGILGNVFFRLFGRLITRFPPPEQISLGTDLNITLWYYSTLLLGIISTLLLLYQCFRTLQQKNIDYQRYVLLLVWLVVGILLFGFYKKPIYDYYFGFMFPLPFLLFGNLLSILYTVQWKPLPIGMIVSVAIFLALFLLNLDGRPMRYPPNRQLTQVREISQFVLEKSGGGPFNFALITQGNSDHGYRYFFELTGNKPVAIENFEKDPQRTTVTNQLLIVCEDPSCKPLGHPLWEVAGFGRAEIVGEWPVSVVKVYKLVHYTGE